MVPIHVSTKKHSVKFADPSRNKQANASLSRNSISSPRRNTKAEASFTYKGATSTDSFEISRPDHDTRSTMSDAH